MRFLVGSLFLAACIHSGATYYNGPPVGTTGGGGGGGGGGGDDTSSGEPAAASGASFTLDGGECSSNEGYLLEDSDGTDHGMLSISSSLDLTTKSVPATLCLSENDNDCSSNKVTITASTHKIMVSASCHHLDVE